MKILGAAGLLVFLVFSERLQTGLLWQAWQRPWPLLLGGVLVLMNLLGVGLRFWWLLRSAGHRLALGAALRICFIGHFFNLVLLGGAGGDVVRVLLAGRALEAPMAAAGSVVVDRLSGLTGMVLLVSMAVFLLPAAAYGDAGLRIVAALAAALLSAALAALLVGWLRVAHGRLAALLGVGLAALPGAVIATQVVWRGGGEHLWWVTGLIGLAMVTAAGSAWWIVVDQGEAEGPGPWFRRFARQLRPYLRRPSLLLRAAGISLLVQLPMVAALPCFAVALGLPVVGWLAQAVAGPVALLANVLPLPAGGLGGGEAAYALVLERFAAFAPFASVFLMLRLWLVVYGSIGAWLLWRQPSQRPEAYRQPAVPGAARGGYTSGGSCRASVILLADPNTDRERISCTSSPSSAS